MLKKKKIYPTYILKYNSNREKQVILLMISDGEKWHYLALQKLSALLKGITSKNNGDFYCLNCLHSFKTKNKPESHKKVRENKDFYNVTMRSEDTRILEFNQYQTFDEASFIIYADVECVTEKTDGCKNNPENSATTKVSEHIPSDFSMSTISLFKSIENKHDVYRCKDCIKKFCKYLREQAMERINFKKKKNEVINKRAGGTIWKYKNLLYLQRKIWK